MYPASKFRQYWDIIIILFVVYNVIVMPMEIGINLESTPIRSAFESVVDILFFIDICLNFFTGFTDDMNKLTMDPKIIALRYIKAWFFIDLFATLPFELIAAIFGIDAGSNVKLFALLKCPRLLRLGRIMKFLENMKGANIMRIVRLFVLYFLVSHWVGCLWFLIASPDDYPVLLN